MSEIALKIQQSQSNNIAEFIIFSVQGLFEKIFFYNFISIKIKTGTL